MTEKIQDLGDWAEDRFSSLCAVAGVTRNKSLQDRTGWDYLVEFAPKRLAGMPLDMQPAGTTAKVQVKSKRSGRPSARLKLSNALLFATDPAPCFLVLFLAEDGGEPVRIYAKHFWDKMIEDTLRKAREVGVGEEVEPHKISLSVTFTKADDHTDDLLAWMAETATGRGTGYAAEKARIVQTVGLGDDAYRGSLSIRADAMEALVDHQIGLDADVPITQFSLVQRRFGIDFDFGFLPGQPSFFSMRSHPRPCRMRFRQGGFEDVWVDAELFLPGIPGLPLELQKHRVVGDFLEVVFNNANDESSVKFRSSGEKRRSLSEIRALIDVRLMSEKGPIDLAIQVPECVLRKATLRLSPEGIGDRLERFSMGLRSLQRVAENTAPPELTLTIPEIEAAWDDLASFHALVAGEALTGNLSMQEPFEPPKEPVSFYAYGHVEIGPWCFMAVVARTIESIQANGTEVTIPFGEPRIVETLVQPGPADAHLPHLVALYRAALRAPNAGTFLELYGGDSRAIFAHMIDGDPAT